MPEPPINSFEAPKPSARAFAALICANICLAFGPWLVRLADTGPVASAFWRMALALPFLFLLARATGQRLGPIGPGLWIVLALSGLFFAADLAAWHAGILETKLANATLFANSTSLIFPLYGFFVARAWPSRSEGIALLLAGAGGALLMGRSYEASPEQLIGDLLCLFAGLLYALYFIAMARAREALAPLPALAWSTLAGVAPLLIFAVLLGERVWPGDWGPLILLALVSQLVGQGLMIYALGHFRPIVIGLALLVQPVVSGTVGWVVYDERLGALDFAGAAAIAAALVLVRRPKRQAARDKPRNPQFRSP